jgi:hypothetical protein
MPDWIDKATDMLALAIDLQKTDAAYFRQDGSLELINSEHRALLADLLIKEAHRLNPEKHQ